MKKNIIRTFVMSLLLIFSISAFAATEVWLVDEKGDKKSKAESFEITESINAGKVRLRESNQTVGLLKEGDRVTITLVNGVFNSPPKLEDPAQTQINPVGSSGLFWLRPMAGYKTPGINSITYELIEKTEEEHEFAYDNLDYVFVLDDIKPLGTGDVSIKFSGTSPTTTTSGPLITRDEITVAEIIKKNTKVIQKKLVEEEHMELAANILPLMRFQDYYNVSFTGMELNFPKTFFTAGQMFDFYSEYQPYNLKVVNTIYKDIEFSNPSFSENILDEFYEVKPYIHNRISKRDILIDSKANYEGVKMTLNPGQLNASDSYKLIPVKYVPKEDGSYKKEMFTTGEYNPIKREFSFNIPGPGLYGMEKKDINQISLRIGDAIARVNTQSKSLDVAPQLINNSTYVPIRFIAENLGAEVEFLQATNQVQIKTTEKTIYLPIDKITPELATPARIIEGRTMVPVRYVSEQLGAIVNYFADTRKIEIIK